MKIENVITIESVCRNYIYSADDTKWIRARSTDRDGLCIKPENVEIEFELAIIKSLGWVDNIQPIVSVTPIVIYDDGNDSPATPWDQIKFEDPIFEPCEKS